MTGIEELAAKLEQMHRIRLDRDDPVLLLASAAKLILEDGRADFAATAMKIADQMSAGSAQAETAAKFVADRLITEAARAASSQIADAGTAVRRGIEAEAASAHDALKDLLSWYVKLAVFNGVAAAVMVGAVIALLLRGAL